MPDFVPEYYYEDDEPEPLSLDEEAEDRARERQDRDYDAEFFDAEGAAEARAWARYGPLNRALQTDEYDPTAVSDLEWYSHPDMDGSPAKLEPRQSVRSE